MVLCDSQLRKPTSTVPDTPEDSDWVAHMAEFDRAFDQDWTTAEKIRQTGVMLAWIDRTLLPRFGWLIPALDLIWTMLIRHSLRSVSAFWLWLAQPS